MSVALRLQGLVSINTNPQSARPLMLGGNMPTGVSGVAYNGAIWAYDGTGGYVLTVVSKPSWMTLTNVGGGILVATGTAGARGAVVISVTDSSTTTTQASFFVDVRSSISGSPGFLIQKGSPGPPVAYGPGVPYAFDAKCLLNAPTLPLASAVVSVGTLPGGMAIASDALITAHSVTGTTQNVTLTLTDGAGKVAVIPLQLIVKPGMSLSITAPTAVLGIPYAGQVTVSGGSGEYSVVARAAAPLAAGIVVSNPRTGKLGGTPTALTPTSGPVGTIFDVTDLVTGQTISNSISPRKIPVGSAFAPAARGTFATADATGALTSLDVLGQYFGDGIDGDLALDGVHSFPSSMYTRSGTTYTQQRPIYANSITFSAGVTLNVNNWPTWVKTNTDVTAAGILITVPATSGVGHASPWFGNNPAGGAAVVSTATGQHNGLQSLPLVAPNQIGDASASGAGGTGGGGGLPGSSATAQTSQFAESLFPVRSPLQGFAFATGAFTGGVSGPSGGAGAGNGTTKGGDGGAGGDGGGIVWWFTRVLTTSASTTAPLFQADGGPGLAGGPAGGAGRGAGGGGSAGAGGIVWVVCGFRDGPAVPGLLQANGGIGGLNGTTGLGNAATPGFAASGGFCFGFELSSGNGVDSGATSFATGSGVGTPGTATVTF